MTSPMPSPRRGEPTASVAEARSALDYWVRRLDRLPHRRRAARREARVMIARWERRHRDAVVAARAGRPLGRVVSGLGLTRLLEPPRPPGGPVERYPRGRARPAASARRSRERPPPGGGAGSRPPAAIAPAGPLPRAGRASAAGVDGPPTAGLGSAGERSPRRAAHAGSGAGRRARSGGGRASRAGPRRGDRP